MSLDIYLQINTFLCPHCGERITVPGREEYAYTANITHNLGRMADEAGIYDFLWRPEEIGVTKARELIAPLEHGLRRLRENPVRYQVFNPSNGWGSYEGLVRFVENYLEACKEYPDADVEVCR